MAEETPPLPSADVPARKHAIVDRDTLRNTLIALLEDDTGSNFANLDDGKKLRTDLGLDSVDVVSMVSQIERRFRIRLDQRELEELVTVGDVLDIMGRKMT